MRRRTTPHDNPDRAKDKIEDRISINETRARCVEVLRKTLGSRFTGGFASSEFTRKHYGHLVAPLSATAQVNYIATLRSHPICVATTGLHGSIGWKLAEYVAFSKAVLTEKLVYQVPGEFRPGHNYLEFSSPDECAERAVELIEDTGLRHTLMKNNELYYRRHVRPDALIKNAIETALARHSIDETAGEQPAGARRDSRELT